MCTSTYIVDQDYSYGNDIEGPQTSDACTDPLGEAAFSDTNTYGIVSPYHACGTDCSHCGARLTYVNANNAPVCFEAWCCAPAPPPALPPE